MMNMDNNLKNNTPTPDTDNLQPVSADEKQAKESPAPLQEKTDGLNQADWQEKMQPENSTADEPEPMLLESEEAIAHDPEGNPSQKTEELTEQVLEAAVLSDPAKNTEVSDGELRTVQPDMSSENSKAPLRNSALESKTPESNAKDETGRKADISVSAQVHFAPSEPERKKPDFEEGSFIADELALNQNAQSHPTGDLPDLPSKMASSGQNMPADSSSRNAGSDQGVHSGLNAKGNDNTSSRFGLPPKPEQEAKTASHIPPVPEDALSVEEQSIEEMKKEFSAGWKSLLHPAAKDKETRPLRITILVLSLLLFIGLLLPFLTVRADFYGRGNLSRSFALISTWAGWLYLILLITMDGFVILDKRSLSLVFGVLPAILLVFATLYNMITGLIAIHDTGYFLFRIGLSAGFYVLMLTQIVITVLCVIYFIKDPARKKTV